MQVGEYNSFKVGEINGDEVEVLSSDGDCHWLKSTSAQTHYKRGETVSLFVRTDEQGHAQISEEKPQLTLGGTGFLRVVSSRDTGSWLDWGLSGDLFMPRSECRFAVKAGDRILVCLYRDNKTDRLVASTRLHRHYAESATDLAPDQAVDLVIASRTELGYKAVVNQRYLGLLYTDEVFRPLQPGDAVGGFVKSIRADGRIDLTLQARPTDLRDELSARIIADLQISGGTSTLTDKSPPEAIYTQYQVSKKNYKKALGSLYRQRRILITATAITLVTD